MPDIAQQISSLLQAKWTLPSPGVADITWASTRFEAAQDVPGNFVVSCYNPGGPVSADPLSREVWQLLEDVIIDILVKVSAGTALAIESRESMRQQVYEILHLNQFGVSGCNDVYPVRETTKVESPQLVRVAIMVRCRSFNIH
jgi:hypothetical protein